jgi:hypothetical protein
VDTKAARVLYAEASKDVVDFLFSLLTLPVGTVVKILGNDAMVGSIGNLYGSQARPWGVRAVPPHRAHEVKGPNPKYASRHRSYLPCCQNPSLACYRVADESREAALRAELQCRLRCVVSIRELR